MRIGFIGAGGTGKTTTIDLLEKDPDFPAVKVPSVVRDVYKKHALTEESMAKLEPAERWFIQKEMFDLRMGKDLFWTQENVERPELAFISERTLLDHLSYCFYYSAPVISDEIARSMEVLVRTNLENYSKLFYFPMGYFDLQPDGLRRPTLYAYRATIDSIMRGILRRLEIGSYLVPRGTPEYRTNWVKERILNQLVSM